MQIGLKDGESNASYEGLNCPLKREQEGKGPSGQRRHERQIESGKQIFWEAANSEKEVEGKVLSEGGANLREVGEFLSLAES